MIDEANLMSNIYERSFGALLMPLDYDQFAPVGFLWLIKATTYLGPPTEFHLRALPIGFSVAAIILFTWMLYREAGTISAIWPVAAMGTGGMFLRYAAEIKQYGLDLLVSIVLLWLFTIWKKDRDKRSFYWLVLAGCWAIFLSMPSIFILAGIGAAIVFSEGKNIWRSSPNWVMLIWPIAFMVNYIFFLSPGIADDGLQGYHSNYFLGGDMGRNLDLVNTLIYSTTGHTALAIAGGWLLLLTGLIYLFRKDTPTFLLILIAILCPLLASLGHKYSLIPRLLIFLFPLVLFSQAFAFRWLADIRPRMALPAVALWCVLVLPGNANWSWLPGKLVVDEFRAPLNLLAEKAGSGTIYIHHHAVPGFRFYTRHAAGNEAWKDLDVRIGKWEDWSGDPDVIFRKNDVRYLLLVHIGKEEKEKLLEQISHVSTFEVLWENEQGDAILYFP